MIYNPKRSYSEATNTYYVRLLSTKIIIVEWQSHHPMIDNEGNKIRFEGVINISM